MTLTETAYAVGPSAIAAGAGLAIAAYTWRRSRVASLATLLWVGAAIVIGRLPLLGGLPEWRGADAAGFVIFGALAFTPAVLLLAAAWRLPRVRALLEGAPTSALVLTQTYRVAGVFLLLGYLRGELPVQVGLVTGVLDLVVAATALLLAIHLRHDGSRSPGLVIAWATLALADFGWAMLLVTASFLGLVALDPAPAMMGNPPLLVISLFALPFGIFVSVVLIARMRGAGTAPARGRG